MKCITIVLIAFSLSLGVVHLTEAQETDNNRNKLAYQPRQTSFYKSGLDTLQYVAHPSVFNPQKLPFFCKYEHKLDVKIPLKVRFRLGSLDYVNRLEGKY